MPALIEEGREWVAGGAEDALLAEAAALVEEVTDGAEHFSETAGRGDRGLRIPARGAATARAGRETARDRPRSTGRFTRSAPEGTDRARHDRRPDPHRRASG